MKTDMPEIYRVRGNHRLATDSSFGNNGYFKVPHPKIVGYWINCIVSDGRGWEHVSVTLTADRNATKKKVNRCPTWEEMCLVKDMFWNADETVIQLHPPKSEHVNIHNYCLHLWKPQDSRIPLPEMLMI